MNYIFNQLKCNSKLQQILYQISINEIFDRFFKVGLSPSKTFTFIYFNEAPLKIIKKTFYFMLKNHFVFEVFTFLS